MRSENEFHKVVSEAHKLCLICMEEHDVYLVEVEDTEEYLGKEVMFIGKYEYCHRADEYLETMDMFTENISAMKRAFEDGGSL